MSIRGKYVFRKIHIFVRAPTAYNAFASVGQENVGIAYSMM